MLKVVISGTALSVSRLSFGTGSLHHLPTSSRKQDVLAAAFECGFTHFDTAPYYGFGLAEQELGRFLATRRDRVTVTTKVGLYPPNHAKPTAASVWARKAVGRVVPKLSAPVVDWSTITAARSLERSLRRLKSDYVDLLLLHDPLPELVEDEIFLSWLEDQCRRGSIRAWGLAGEAEHLTPWLATSHPIGMVLQVRDSLAGQEADPLRNYGREFQFTYGYLSAARRQSPQMPAEEALAAALRRNTTGSIIVSARHCKRVKALAAIAERIDAAS